MTELYKPGEPREATPTKYDACVLRSTGKEYRNQKGSGRSEVLARFAAEGKTLGELAKEAAAAGYETNFVISSVLKHSDSGNGSWRVEAPEGTTMAAIKAQRQPRVVSPEVAAKRAAAAAEKAAKVEAKAAAKAQAESERQAKADERTKAKEAKEAEKAAKKQEREAARAANAPAKGKGKGKSQENASDGESGAAAA